MKTTTVTGTSLNKRFNEENNGCGSAKSLYISLPSSAKGERKSRRLILSICISNLSLCSGFGFVTVLTVINKVNDLGVSRDS